MSSALVMMLFIAAAACTAPGYGGLAASPIPGDALQRFGQFETVDLSEARVSAADALSRARDEAFGRPGEPQITLARYRGSGTDLVTLPDGALVWIYRWSNLSDEYPKAFPGPSGIPIETVFVFNEYFLFIHALSGEVIAGISQ